MEKIQTYTYPQGQQLSDGELIQVQVKSGSRLVFKDAYFHELQEGDVYIIPAQAKLPPATDTEILDFMLDKGIGWNAGGEHLIIWEKSTQNNLFVSHTVTNLRGAFREAITELIHNTEL